MSEATPTPEKPKSLEFTVEEPVVRQHSLKIGTKTLKYSTKCGRMPLRNELGEIEAMVFYIAYTLDGNGPKKDRPILFSFNGGPGSPSLWLHLGTIGPKRIPMANGGFLPKPPYELEPNAHGWLEFADVVFIDPVGTGYSQGKDKSVSERFWGMTGDIESVSEFIRLYLGENHRFGSPVYLVGESYGTTRAAGISNNLVRRGIGLNGIILVSTVLNFQTLREYPGNDLPAILYLPSFAATAWHHGKVDKKKHPKLRPFLHEVEEFAIGEYASAMMLGDTLPVDKSKAITGKIAEYLGVSEEFVRLNNNRVDIMRFCKELRRGERITVGRLDSRITGQDLDTGGEHFEHDPSMSALMPPYTMAFNSYVREELGYETHLEYEIFKGVRSQWTWDMPKDGPPDTSAELAAALVRNPHTQIYVASGFYDLATPYFATEFTLSHMALPADVRKNITIGEYEAGHMMYTHEASLEKLKKDIGKFFEKSR